MPLAFRDYFEVRNKMGRIIEESDGQLSSLNNRRSLFGCRDTGWKFKDADITEVYFGTLGFQAKVSLPHRGVADRVHEFAVNRQLYGTVHTDDVVDVPLAFTFAPQFQ